MSLQLRALSLIQPNWNDEARGLVEACEKRRPPTNTATGTMSRAACAYLSAITTVLRPSVIVEIGTFIGTSILAMHATEHKYTCDKDNDLLPSSEGLTVYPRTPSTTMLRELVQQDVIADFMFLDGRAVDDDLPLIRRLSRAGTVYGFDDFEGLEKGVWNVRRFIPWLPHHVLIPPPRKVPYVKGVTTIALLAPRSIA